MKKSCISLSILLLTLALYSSLFVNKANADSSPFGDVEVTDTKSVTASDVGSGTVDVKENNEKTVIFTDPGAAKYENWVLTGNATDSKGVATDSKGVASDTKDATKKEESKTSEYTVVPGDYLIKIASEKLGDGSRWREIVELNKDRYPSLLSNPNLIYSGWTFTLPAPGVSNTSGSSTSVSGGTSYTGSIQNNGKATDSSGWGSCSPCSPMPGYISSEYGPRDLFGHNFHNGIDIPVSTGTRVNAMANGTVIGASYEPGGGNFVRIKYDNGYETFYCHLQSSSVKVGDRVVAGQQVAVSDNTGQYTTGAHLHMEVKVNGTRVNPRTAYNGFPPKK